MKKACFFIFLILSGFSIIKGQGVYKIWGATHEGGPDNFGTLFSTDLSGNNLETHYTFKQNHGSTPGRSVLMEYNGKFYSTAILGGANNVGVIYEWNPVTNEYTVKYHFLNSLGGRPNGSMSFYNGRFYGTTEEGGVNDKGVIYEWDPVTNVYTKKIDLSDDLGSRSYNGMTLVGNTFYGMLNTGGASNKGVIFEWDPATNIYTKKIDLGTATGASPLGKLTYYAGKLYGVTGAGGANNVGVIFEWDPATNIYTKKIDLSNTLGSPTASNLALYSNKFYGMTSSGGANNVGVIFEWDPATNIYTKKIEFSNSTSHNPQGSLVLHNNNKFYGLSGASDINTSFAGDIFEWDPATNIYTVKSSFLPSEIQFPGLEMTWFNDKFYGLAGAGGGVGNGLIFEWDPLTNICKRRVAMNASPGSNATGAPLLFNGKFYGTTRTGGRYASGVIYEWDNAKNLFTTKFDFSGTDGFTPVSMVLYNDKFYGVTNKGGANSQGTIYEWNPVTNIYSKKIDLVLATGGQPLESMFLKDNKFYGTAYQGGANGAGVLFEWDPATNVYSNKINLAAATGSGPMSALAAFGNKLYGVTNAGGVNNAGVIFEWDPVSNIYTDKFHMAVATGSSARKALYLYQDKFYGTTFSGGANGKGVIFEWDPATNVYTKKVDLATATGANGMGAMIMSNGKFYGMTSRGGSSDVGVLFEWDPVTNVYNLKTSFTGSNGAYPNTNNLLTLPAPVAKGQPGSCLSLTGITIDNSNNNKWVAITDAAGNAVAEIKANGNNLGTVQASVYINNSTVREDNGKKLYLDRNVSINVTNQPATAVDIRLYLLDSEYQRLKNAVNSNGQSSGVMSINDLSIFKNTDNCSGALTNATTRFAAAPAGWNGDHVLSTSIPGFSTFYIASTAGAVLPIKIIEFKGRRTGEDVLLSWKVNGESDLRMYAVERSTDGSNFSVIGEVAALNRSGNLFYQYKDEQPGAQGILYYRLKAIDMNGRATLSSIVPIAAAGNDAVLLYPNPVKQELNLSVQLKNAGTVSARIIDRSGKQLKTYSWKLAAGGRLLKINSSSLPAGLYWLEIKGDATDKRISFVKE